MIIKYKGTDEHGVFRMGVTKLPDYEAYQAFVDSHPEYEIQYTDSIGATHTTFPVVNPSPHN